MQTTPTKRSPTYLIAHPLPDRVLRAACVFGVHKVNQDGTSGW